jgi:predicted MFS family arabinose efflux permease
MSRAFWLGSGVIFLDEVLYLAIVPLLPSFAARFDLSTVDVAMIVAVYPLFMLASSVPAGLLADRIGGRALLALGSGILVLASLAFAYAETEWQLWVARGVQGLTSGLTSTAGMAVIAQGAASARRATVIGLATAVQGLSTLAGPALGGYVAPAAGLEAAFLIPAAAALVLLVAFAWPGWDSGVVYRVPGWRETFERSARDPRVRAAVATLFVVGVAQGALYTLVPLSLAEVGYTPAGLGTIFMLGALLGLVLAPAAGRAADALGTVRVTAAAFAVVPLLMLALGFAPVAGLAAAATILVWPLLRTGGSLGFTLAAEQGPLGPGLATACGLAVAAWSLGAVAGPLAAGAVADVADSALSYAVLAGVVGLLTLRLGAGRFDQPARCAP